MKISSFARIWLQITGWVVVAIGMAHNAFAPMMYQQMKADPTVAAKAGGMVFFFVGLGVAFMLAGALTSLAARAPGTEQKLARWVIVLCNLFLFGSAVFATFAAKFGNSLVYTMGACAVLNLVVLLLVRRADSVTAD